ncbi:hypothetical protein G5B37_05335 [Rasiella rasia]|uniref:Uncharacterized protein n=1 Tax=Rasiella rasia TaxID=2744027 RepID=A0A6G6GKF7_9FLAO|nr:hypothetical protein [Rasiella rasia]QIE59004.1 hypothetical protein G5B37_05335 [Rasiella rasia]
MKNVYIFFLVAISTLTISCDKGDDDSSTDGSMDLEATVFFDYVEFSWKRPTREVNIDVSYDLYLNDELLEANKLNPGYVLEDLMFNTSYVFKVIGDIDGAIYTEEIAFSTINPDDYNFLLKSIGADEPYCFYDNNELLSSTESYVTDLEFVYDSQGRITKQLERGDIYGIFTDFEYLGTSFSYIKNAFISDTPLIMEYDFTSSNAYSIRHRDNLASPTFDYTYTVELNRNAQGKIQYFEMFNANGVTIDEMTFEYANENLVQLNDVKNDVLYEIAYDTKKSYATYTMFAISGGSPTKLAAGVRWLDIDNLYGRLKYIPELFLMRSANNVVSIKVNGDVLRTYGYEYSGLEYPTEITYDNGNSYELNYYIEEN